MARSRLPATDNIPLRLRRRRDGSLALTDHVGRLEGDVRAFPTVHVFTAATGMNLAGAGALRFDGDLLTVSLCNAEATYRVTERRANGELVAELESASLGDPPPVDEKQAEALAAAREG